MESYHQHSKLSDEELLQAYRTSKDNTWLGYLLQRYTMLLLGVAMKYLKDKELAQDAVQQVFEKALTHLPQEEIHNFKGWLYILMRNHCLQILRDKSYFINDEWLQNVAAENNKDELRQKDHSLDQMEAALKELNDVQRQAIVLFYLQKQSYQQIMEQTGFSFEQVKSYIQNGKRNLKLIMEKKLAERK
ncbi:MAG: RNA polymerase sigma factor [Flavipsychrobacter sp.]